RVLALEPRQLAQPAAGGSERAADRQRGRRRRGGRPLLGQAEPPMGVTSYSEDVSRASQRLPPRHPVGRIASLPPIWLIVFAAAGFGQLASSLFLSSTNILNLLQQSSVLGITAMGVTFVMLAGELDVSNAGVVTVSAVAAAGVMGGDDAKIPLGILV